MDNVVLAFGSFTPGTWGWRVEWMERGKLKTKDFIQTEVKAGESFLAAKTFKEDLQAKFSKAA